MSEVAKPRLNAAAFIAWAMRRPKTERYELVAGEVVAMAPERVAHVKAKFAITLRLNEAIAAGKLPCLAYVDGIAIRVDDETVYIPDAIVHCGENLPDDVVEIDNPIVVVEIVSPSSEARDNGPKLADYFRLPSVRHYLIFMTDRPTVIHHERQDTGDILTRIVTSGGIRLDPPGIELPELFPLVR